MPARRLDVSRGKGDGTKQQAGQPQNGAGRRGSVPEKGPGNQWSGYDGAVRIARDGICSVAQSWLLDVRGGM